MNQGTNSTPNACASASYNIYRDRYRFLHDSYWGGDRYRNPSSATLSAATTTRYVTSDSGQTTMETQRYRSYLVPHPKESDENFLTRLRLAIYVNVVAPIVDAYAEACTTNVSRDVGALDLTSVDALDHDWGELVEDSARWAGLYGWILGVVDAPRLETPPANLAEEKAAGIKPSVVTVPPSAIAWIKTNARSEMVEVAYVEQAYKDDQSPLQTVTVRVFRPGVWEVRRGTFKLDTGISNHSDDYELIESGALPPSLNGRLPIHALFYRRVAGPHPLGHSLVEDAADIARAIYNALSWANETHRKAGFPFLAVPMGSTGGQMDANTQRTIGPDQGFPYDANTGGPQWIQPSAESTQELREHCGWLFQMALRTAGLEVAADSSAQVQSGEALRIRSRDFESRASRFARNLQRWEVRMLTDYAILAGEPITPKVTYPQRFTLPDPAEELANALSILKDVPVEIGPTAKARAVMQALRAALGLSDQEASDLLQKLEAIYSGDMQEFDEERKSRSLLRTLQSKSGVTDGTADRPTADGADSLPSGATANGSADG